MPVLCYTSLGYTVLRIVDVTEPVSAGGVGRTIRQAAIKAGLFMPIASRSLCHGCAHDMLCLRDHEFRGVAMTGLTISIGLWKSAFDSRVTQNNAGEITEKPWNLKAITPYTTTWENIPWTLMSAEPGHGAEPSWFLRTILRRAHESVVEGTNQAPDLEMY